MGRGGGGSGGSHGGGGGHFNYGSSRSGGHSRGGGRSSSNYSPVYRTSYYRPMTPLGGTLNTPLDELADSVLKKYGEEDDE